MLGAIAGDVIGSVYEASPVKSPPLTMVRISSFRAALSWSGVIPASPSTSWVRTTCSVLPASRCSRVSPTQTMAVSPAVQAASVFAWTVASVSP